MSQNNQVLRKWSQKSIIQDVFWMFLLIISSYFVDHIFSFPFGPIFITPFKISLIISFVVALKYLRLKSFLITDSNIILYAFFLYNGIITISLFYSEYLTFSQVINYFILNISSMFVVLGLSKAIVLSKSINFVPFILKLFILIFCLEVIVSFIELITKEQFFNIGALASSSVNFVKILGFHWDRVFLCEYLVLGVAALYFKFRKWNLLNCVALLISMTIIYISDSYTGRLLLIALLFIMPKIRIKTLISVGIIGFIAVNVVLPQATKSFLTESDLIIRQSRQEKYFDDYSKNWRIFSSLALINEFMNEPTFFGKGFKANDYFLSSLSEKFKNVSSHTLISVAYDQGLMGIVFTLLFIVSICLQSFRLYFASINIEDYELFILCRMSIVFSWIVVLRFSFYYQAIHIWHYLICVIFLYVSFEYLNEYKKKNLNILT